MKKILLILLAYLVLAFYSCADDCTPVPPENPCDEFLILTEYTDTCFQIPQPIPLQIYDSLAYDFDMPNFDKVNPNRFLYGQYLIGGSSYWVIDQCKEEYIQVLDEAISGQVRPKLGRDDWIIYSTPSHLKLMIKKIGDENATELIPQYKCTYPLWLPDNLIMCLAEGENFDFKTVIININGDIIQELNAVIPFEEKHGKVSVYTGALNNREIGYLDIEADYSYTPVISLDEDAQGVLSMDWLDEQHIVWTDNFGMHKVNIQTQEITTLKENCENRRILWLTSSPSQNGTILLSEVHYWPVDAVSMYVDIDIFQFDTYNNEEFLVELEVQQ